MQKKFPKIASEWNSTLNSDLTPEDVTYGSGRKVWWTCSSGHDYEATVSNRTLGKGCPYCAGQKVGSDNNLEHLYPEVAQSWHPTKNAPLIPTAFRPYSHKKVWWRCQRFPEHEWQAAISSRTKGHGCPLCSKQTSLPELRIFTELKNLFPDAESRKKIGGRHEADILIPSEGIAIEFDGAFYHRDKTESDARKSRYFQAQGIKLIRIRVRPLEQTQPHDILVDEGELKKTDLNLLASKIESIADVNLSEYIALTEFVNDALYRRYVEYLPDPFPEDSLSNTNPEIAAEWDYEKNHPLTPRNFTSGSSKKVWWQCAKNPDHSWESAINDRARRGCPYCAGKRVTKATSLNSIFPEIATEWHPVKNQNLTPNDFLSKSNKRVWWLCPKGHDYQMPIAARTSGRSNCPFCAGKRVTPESSLAHLHPDIASQWHPKKNSDVIPEAVFPNSQKKRWWLCSVDPTHEWEATVASRVSGTGCPVCSGRIATSFNSLLALHPELAKEFDEEKNDMTSDQIKPGSGKKVWWQCSANSNHKWEAVVYSRTKLKTGCPECWRKRRSRGQ